MRKGTGMLLGALASTRAALGGTPKGAYAPGRQAAPTTGGPRQLMWGGGMAKRRQGRGGAQLHRCDYAVSRLHRAASLRRAGWFCGARKL